MRGGTVKKLINKPGDMVTENLEGIALAYPDLVKVHYRPDFVSRADAPVDEITEMLTLSIIEDPAWIRTVQEWDAEKGDWVEIELVDPPFQKGDQVLAFVNSMGGTPSIELSIVYRKLHEICEKKGLRIVRNLIGAYITSLEMQGCSITLLKMDDEIINLWGAPVKTPGLRWGV